MDGYAALVAEQTQLQNAIQAKLDDLNDMSRICSIITTTYVQLPKVLLV